MTSLDNTYDLVKRDLRPSQWKKLAETTIAERYSRHHKFFTDASKQANGRTGIGITDERSNRTIERISELFQISSAELVAILKVVLYAENVQENEVVILTDSLTSCGWLTYGNHDNYLVHLIREQMIRLHDKHFTLQWIPSHVGIPGNEEADDLANRGCWLTEISPLKITYSDAKCEVRRRMIEDWQRRYEHLSETKGRLHFTIQGKASLKPWFQGLALNGKQIKTLTRLRTNHGMCGNKKYLFKLEPTWLCDECKVTNDLQHMILHCNKYQPTRTKFNFHECHDMSELLSKIDAVRYREIANFCEEAGLNL